MAQVLPGNSAKVVQISSWKTYLVGILVVMLCVAGNESAQAVTGGSPYDVPPGVDTTGAAGPSIATIDIVATEVSVNIAPPGSTPVMANNVMTFNGTIPGPEIRVKVGDTVIVNFTNDLDHATGIHWHGIELDNRSDGTPLTQPPVAPGGTFTYKFKVTRPGIFWYHPHHHSATNQVFKGLYGSLIVKDPYEAQLQAMNVIPSDLHTKTLVLSDITVCKDINDTVTFDTSLPHVSGMWSGNNAGPSPKVLCEIAPLNAEGGPGTAFVAGDVPNIVKLTPGPVGEGQTVLTNGVNVGASALEVQPGQGLRLQIINAAATRYFRLRLTDNSGVQIPLVRIGGQGGLLNKAIVEGGVVVSSGFDFNYNAGEILIPPGSREDIVAAIPNTATGVLTLWTDDFKRTGAQFAWIPTVPVVHLNVAGEMAPPYTIAENTLLRQLIGGGAKVEKLKKATGHFLPPPPPSDGDPTPGLPSASEDIRLTNRTNEDTPLPFPSVDGIRGEHDFGNTFPGPHMGSARYARLGDTLELTATNVTGAHHPLHLHGFSIQPISLTDTLSGDPGNGPNASPGIGPSYKFPYEEFRDEVDIPGGYTLTFRVRLDDRSKFPGAGAEELTGGGLGRWFFHCHVLFHAGLGMISELDVLPAN